MATEYATQNISPEVLNNLKSGAERVTLIDVSTPAEFREMHVDAAQNYPIGSSELAALMATRPGACAEPWYVMCRGGVRSVKVCNKFPDANLVNVEGGLKQWRDAGLSVKHSREVVTLERQARMAAGLLVVLGCALGAFVHPYLLGLPALVGAGLFLGGATNSGGAAMVLAKMPWNREKRSATTGTLTTYSH